MRYVEVPPAERDALLRGDYREALRLYHAHHATAPEPVPPAKPMGGRLVQRIPEDIAARQARRRGVRFTDEDIRRIRASTERDSVVAREWGVSHSMVARIRERRSYRWIQ